MSISLTLGMKMKQDGRSIVGINDKHFLLLWLIKLDPFSYFSQSKLPECMLRNCGRAPKTVDPVYLAEGQYS